MTNPRYNINFASLVEPLTEIPVAIANRIDNEHRAALDAIDPGLPMLVKWTVQVAGRTFEGARHLAREDEANPNVRFRTVVCIPPLARSIIDNLFSVTFLFDDPVANSRWYLASTWRDGGSEFQLLQANHGSDPEWTQWLADYGAWLDSIGKDARISDAEKKDPELIRQWPLPGQMTHGQKTGGLDMTQDPDRQAFLRHLRLNYYGSLSGDAHLSGLGFARRGSLIHDGSDDEKLVRLSQNFLRLTTLYVALLSEVVGQLRMPHEAVRLRQIWQKIGQWPEASDLFSKRYDKWLPGVPLAGATG
jgi:hypothetical protein